MTTLLVAAPRLPSQTASSDSAAVHAAVMDFVRAFENLDWERFRAAFADDATVFFPLPEPPGRFAGRAAVEAQFTRVFEAIRRQSSGGPPYHRLPPVDLRIAVLGPSAALVTFELRNPERVGRRTLVLQRENDRWLITHLHASNVATSAASPKQDER
jgi:ketosteroid isomerase-like protein